MRDQQNINIVPVGITLQQFRFQPLDVADSGFLDCYATGLLIPDVSKGRTALIFNSIHRRIPMKAECSFETSAF
jgi:hypothetical protein